jgi:hypothetical protein
MLSFPIKRGIYILYHTFVQKSGFFQKKLKKMLKKTLCGGLRRKIPRRGTSGPSEAISNRWIASRTTVVFSGKN